MRRSAVTWASALVLSSLLAACSTSGPHLGDPCRVEVVPRGGFVRDEVFLELGSVQCRSRVCLAFGLSGNPNHVLGESSCPCVDGTLPDADASVPCALRFDDCIDRFELERRMHCSCRCGLLPGTESSLPLCDCPRGFVCEGERSQGGDGLAGLYCIPDDVAAP